MRLRVRRRLVGGTAGARRCRARRREQSQAHRRRVQTLRTAQGDRSLLRRHQGMQRRLLRDGRIRRRVGPRRAGRHRALRHLGGTAVTAARDVERETSMKGHIVRAFAIAALAAAAGALSHSPAVAAPHFARPAYLGPVSGTAEKYFTVDLRDGATGAEQAMVARYFERFGLSVRIASDVNILFVHGTYGEAAAAAHTGFGVFTGKAGRATLLTAPESYPPAIAAHILATTMNDGPSAMSAAQITPSTGYTPANIAKYYDIQPIYNSGVRGAGVNVAIVACNTITPADITTFESDFGLPANSPTIKMVDGGTTTTDLEPTGDVERVIGTAPKANVTLYVLPSSCTFADLADGMAAVDADIATMKYVAMSHSYGATEDLYDYYSADSDLMAEDADLATMLKKGTTPFAVSGDWGAYEPLQQQISVGEVDPWFPASDPNVVAGGGTTAASVSTTNTTRLYELAWGVSG